jgi:hypothetical protein
MLTDMSKLLVIVILAAIAYNVLSANNLIKNTGTLVTGGDATTDAAKQTAPGVVPTVSTVPTVPSVLPRPQISSNFATQGNFQPAVTYPGCFPKDEITATDLLPTEGAFAESNPTPQGTLSNRNLFEAGHHAGLNTQINSLRNGNRQLRSDPLIPRVAVGPWAQSTYEADTNRREFEIGGI